MSITVLSRKHYWVGLSAWRHRTNQVYVGIAWWVICWRVEYDGPWYAIVRRLPISD
jgi:hypothetical protein